MRRKFEEEEEEEEEEEDWWRRAGRLAFEILDYLQSQPADTVVCLVTLLI